LTHGQVSRGRQSPKGWISCSNSTCSSAFPQPLHGMMALFSPRWAGLSSSSRLSESAHDSVIKQRCTCRWVTCGCLNYAPALTSHCRALASLMLCHTRRSGSGRSASEHTLRSAGGASKQQPAQLAKRKPSPSPGGAHLSHADAGCGCLTPTRSCTHSECNIRGYRASVIPLLDRAEHVTAPSSSP